MEYTTDELQPTNVIPITPVTPPPIINSPLPSRLADLLMEFARG